ncbi:O-antigen ligase family protein [Arcobacter cloacae]|nr:O-antigen ligase family protein [Arcobacter cloacae]
MLLIYFKKINYSKIKIFSEKFVIIGILLFAFFVSFDSGIGRKLINNLFYIWLLTLNYKKITFFINANRIFLFILIFAAWILIGCIFTLNNDYNSYDIFFKYFLLPILIISTTIKKEHIQYIISAFLLGMFINEIISYGIYFEVIKSQIFGFNIVGNKYNPVPFLPSHMEYTLFLSLAIVISVFSFFNTDSKVIKIILLVFTLTMITNLFLTTGRTGQFTLLGTLFILIFIYLRHNYKYIILSFLTIIFIFFMGFFFSDNVNKRLKQGYFDIVKVIEDKNYNTSFGVRLSSYILIPKIIQNEDFNILYGTGYSKVNSVVQKIQVNEIGSFMKGQLGHLHNSYITIFAGTGLIGLILLLLIWYYLIVTKIKDDYLNYVRYSFVFIVFLGGFTENMFRQKEIMMLGAIFISIIIVVSTKYNIMGKTDEKK